MRLHRFERLLAIHGADLKDWPDADRREAEALIARSPAAARLRREAARIDQALRDARPEISPDRVERLIAGLEMIPAGASCADAPTPPDGDAVLDDDVLDAPLSRLVRRPWVPAAFLAAMVVIGFLLGGVLAPRDGTPYGEARDLVDLLADRSLAGFAL